MTIVPAKIFTYFRPKFLKPKTRIFTDLRKVFVKSSVHFRPLAFRRESTLARAPSDRSFSPRFPGTFHTPKTTYRPASADSVRSHIRRYTESPICAPTLCKTCSKSAKTRASVHGNDKRSTDAIFKRTGKASCRGKDFADIWGFANFAS